MPPGSFRHQFWYELRALPRWGFVYALLTGLFTLLTDMLHWRNGPSVSAMGAVTPIILMIGDLAASYFIMMAMLRRRGSVRGAFRFATACLLLIASLILFIVLGVLVAAVSGFDVGSSIVYLPMFVWAILASPLTAWPVARAVSAHPKPLPLIWRASRGHRWILAGAALISAVMPTLSPDMSTVGQSLEAVLRATGHSAIDGIMFLLGLCVSVTAWKLALRQESALAPGLPRPAARKSPR